VKRRNFLKGALATSAIPFIPSSSFVALPEFPSVRTIEEIGADLSGLHVKEAVETRWDLPSKTENGTAIFIIGEDILVVAANNQWYRITTQEFE
jgi:hypothetical protein